jgi:hypothetical protein
MPSSFCLLKTDAWLSMAVAAGDAPGHILTRAERGPASVGRRLSGDIHTCRIRRKRNGRSPGRPAVFVLQPTRPEDGLAPGSPAVGGRTRCRALPALVDGELGAPRIVELPVHGIGRHREGEVVGHEADPVDDCRPRHQPRPAGHDGRRRTDWPGSRAGPGCSSSSCWRRRTAPADRPPGSACSSRLRGCCAARTRGRRGTRLPPGWPRRPPRSSPR